MTLVELLIVVGIMLAITAIAIPLMVPSLEERRMLETSRNLTTLFASARSRSIANGRAAGVVLHRAAGLAEACSSLSLAEVQEPYAGGFVGSRIHISGEPFTDTNTNGVWDTGESYTDVIADGYYNDGGVVNAITDSAGGTDSTWLGLVRPGDRLKLDYQGPEYVLQSTSVDADGYITTLSTGSPWTLYTEAAGRLARTPVPVDRTSPADGDYIDPEDSIGGLPFQIIRQPGRSAATPLELPETMIVDLSASGNDTFTLSGVTGDITILFTPGGGVDKVLWAGLPGGGGGGSYRPTSPVFLMIGRRDLVPTVVGQENWRLLANRWIGINHGTGLVTSSENYGGADLAEVRRNALIAQGN
jgi:type II secretory pathway pseudopilin PulG